MTTIPRIWFAGDTHGEFRHIIRCAERLKPEAVIFLGDLELPATLEEVMAPLLRAGIIVRGIHGNHDADSPDLWRRISEGPLGKVFNLDGRVETISGMRIAGLGGIFRGKAWYPPEAPLHRSYDEIVGQLPSPWMRDEQAAVRAAGQRLLHRGTIFPDVYERLASLEADVLVSHEAPGGVSMHPHGFDAIDDLAQVMGVRVAFHGHHHETRRYPDDRPVRWFGVGYRGIIDLNGDPISG